jgi:hypothetical protein
VPDNPGEVDHVRQEPRDFCREKKKGKNTMKLLTWNACRLLAGGSELALVNILTSSGANVTTITECEISEGSGEFSVAGYTTFSPPPNAEGKTRVLVLVNNDLAVRANVKVMTDIMDPAIQSVWLHFNHHKIGSATLGAFILGGIYSEWSPLLSPEESILRLGSLLHQISKATEHGSCVAIHGDFNVDLDRLEDRKYYMATLAKLLAECTLPPAWRRTPRPQLSSCSATSSQQETSHVRPETLQVLQEVGQVSQEVGQVLQEVCQVRQEMGKVQQGTFASTLG